MPKDQVTATGVIQGGPETAPPAEPKRPAADEPKLVAVKLSGREFNLPEDVAQALQAREQEFGQKLSEHSNELGELRKFRQSVQQTVIPPQDQKRDLGTLLFENPNEALGRLRQEIKEEMRMEYGRDQSEQKFWQGLYRKHDDLEGEETLIRAVMQQHWGDLQALPVGDAQDKIADMTRSEILRISKKLRSGKDEELPQDRAVVEGAGSAAPRRKAAEPEGPKSLSEVIRANRTRRLSPAAPKG